MKLTASDGEAPVLEHSYISITPSYNPVGWTLKYTDWISVEE